MKTIMKFFLISSILMFGLHSAFAHDVSTFDEEMIYSMYKFVTPKEILELARDAIKHVKTVGPEKAFADFNEYPPSRWYPMRWASPFTVPINCDEMSILGLPVPELQKIIGQKDLLKKLKDVNGKYYFVEGCSMLKKQEAGFVEIESIFFKGMDFDTRYVWLIVQVPGTPYQITTYFPSKKYQNIDELNEMIKKGLL